MSAKYTKKTINGFFIVSFLNMIPPVFHAFSFHIISNLNPFFLSLRVFVTLKREIVILDCSVELEKKTCPEKGTISGRNVSLPFAPSENKIEVWNPESRKELKFSKGDEENQNEEESNVSTAGSQILERSVQMQNSLFDAIAYDHHGIHISLHTHLWNTDRF